MQLRERYTQIMLTEKHNRKSQETNTIILKTAYRHIHVARKSVRHSHTLNRQAHADAEKQAQQPKTRT